MIPKDEISRLVFNIPFPPQWTKNYPKTEIEVSIRIFYPNEMGTGSEADVLLQDDASSYLRSIWVFMNDKEVCEKQYVLHLEVLTSDWWEGKWLYELQKGAVSFISLWKADT